jgi:ferredoxin-NADP reductase
MATTYPVTLESKVQETPKDRTLVFFVPAGAEQAFRFQPGQFITFRETVDGKALARSYSISSAPEQVGTFEITVRDAGFYGARLYALPDGSTLEAQPPRGGFTLDVTPGRRLLLAAGGSGVTPYRGFLRHLCARGRTDPVALVHSVRAPEELIFRAEFEATAGAHPWLTYVPTITRPPPPGSWAGREGRIDAALVWSLAPHPAQVLVYACGPNEFVDVLVTLARAAGIPPENVRREKWG